MKKTFLSIVMSIFTVCALSAQSDLQVISVVKYSKPESITVKQLKARCETYEKQMGKKLSLDEKKMVLKTLTEEKLMLQAAAKAGINISESTVDQYFNQSLSQQFGVQLTVNELNDLLLKQQGISLDELLMQQTGMNMVEYKTYLKNQLIIQQYVVSLNQSEIMKVAPTDEEIRMFYESNKASFVWNDMVKLFLVIVPKGTNTDSALNKINEFRNKFVDKKITMEELSIQSKIDNSGYQAGEMLLPKTEVAASSVGMTYAGLVSLFEKEEGFVTDVQETDIDYRFVRVGKKYAAKMLSLSDVIQPETTITIYDYIKQNLTQQKQMMFMNNAAQELATSLYKPEYVEEKKTGAALDKLLNWGE